VITCGNDRQVIFWKVVEDTQLLYKNTKNETNCLAILDDEFFCTGSYQSTVDLWSFKKKKPLHKQVECHEYFKEGSVHKHSCVTSINSIRNSDLFATGSIDSSINLYKFDRKGKKLHLLGKLPNVEGEEYVKGTVNALKFSPKREFLAYSHSDEQRLGRWYTSKPKNYGFTIVKLAFKY
jgi:WD40 repeat protein